MGVGPERAIHQAFLPLRDCSHSHVWKFSWEYGGRRPLHFHAEPELNLIADGTATFRVGESVVTANRGDLLAFPPGQEHALLETSPDVYLFAIGAHPGFSSQVLRSESDSVAFPFQIRLAPSDFDALRARCAMLVDRAAVDPSIAELWEHAHWLRHRYIGRHNSMHVFTRRVLALVSEHPDLACERIAQAARASLCEASRYFHRDVGLTLVKYRARLRLLRYIGLVDQGNNNLMESAKAAGFGSYSQCHRVFQAELGCSPRQYFQVGVREQMQAAYVP